MTTQPAYLTQTAGTSRYLTQTAGTNYYLTLQDPAAYANDVDLLLAEAVWYIDAHDAAYDGGQTVPNAGTAGTALNALLGGGTAVTTNDPKWLAYDPADGAYVYLPGVAGNYLSVPDEAALDITGDIDIRVLCALDDWSAATVATLVNKYGSAGDRSFVFRVNTDGKLRLTWYTDGTTGIGVDSTAAVPFSDGATGWVRVTLDVDNGASQYDVKFYTSTDGASWTQLGTTVTGATGVTSIYASTAVVRLGGLQDNTGNPAGKFYRSIVKDGIDGTTVLDVDTSVLTSGDQTTFTEQSSNAATVTVNRSTSGRKTTLVGGWAGGGSLWLLGSDDFMEVSDSGDLLDFGSSDSFTVLAVLRQWATPVNNGPFLDKRQSAGLGYMLANSGTTAASWALVGDGSTSVSRNGTLSYTQGQVSVLGLVVNRSAQTLASISGSTVSATASVAAVGSLASTSPLRVGRQAYSTTYQDMEFQAAAIWRRALTATEIAGLATYFANRPYNG